jgi:SSS family solute:Na+ symporter
MVTLLAQVAPETAQAATQAATQAARHLHSFVEAPHATGAPATYGTPLDWGVILLYLLLILGFGSFFGRYTKNTRDFFFSGARFSWWLIGMSMVATGVGSHSFIKYAQVGYQHGMSSTMSYMNDWFFIPIFMFGWLPIIYFSRVRSIPEYFSRRFNTAARFLAVLVILEYMIGYIGYNLFTLGTAAHQVLGVDVWKAIVVISIISGIYITAGGQTAVIFTDLAQGFMLLFAGLLLFVLGLDALALDGALITGLKTLWATLGLAEKLPFAHFNQPQNFNFVGIFWQDGIAGSMMFLFVSQGVIMRFLAAKSVNEGRKAILFNTVFILPLSAIVVGNAGWLGNAMIKTGLVDRPAEARDIFVTVAEYVCHPGVFGFVLAALSAALMSTIDTLTNATAALFIYDVYQPYVRRNAPDRHYMKASRVTSAITALVGMGVGLFFMTMGKDMYKIHGMFQAFVTPPIIVAVVLGAFWKRYTAWGAVASLVGGVVGIALSKEFPVLVEPFAQGVAPDESGQYVYMTAAFGLACAALCGVVVSLFTKPKSESEIAGLWIGSVNFARKLFKGGEPSFDVGAPVRTTLTISEDGTAAADEVPTPLADAPHDQPVPAYPIVRLGRQAMKRLKADEGDLVYVGDARRYLGGLRSLHAKAGAPHDLGDTLLIAPQSFEAGNFIKGRRVRVEKFF